MTFSMKTVTLEVIQPSTGPVCPGQEVILTCTVTQTGSGGFLILAWRQSTNTGFYDKDNQKLGPDILGDFSTTAEFITSTDSTAIVSNATLTAAALSNSNSVINCMSPPEGNAQTAIIIVAGMCH